MESIRLLISPPEPCHYLPEREWQFEYELIASATPDEYGGRLQQGWRRFGHALFRPVCASCSACRSLRIPVEAFRPDRSQRRAWQANEHDLQVTIDTPSMSDEKQALYDRFHQFQQHAKGWPETGSDYEEMFVRNPFPTEEWCYRIGERLVGVGYVDRFTDGLSAIYFYYEPDERHRSLGTFNVLSTIAAARALRLPYVYLGYYVQGCRSLEYKKRFRPNEVLDRGEWLPFTE